MSNTWTLTPSAGLRFTNMKFDTYSETASDSVFDPLRFSGLSGNNVTALAGVRMMGYIAPKVGVVASVGVEQDLSTGASHLTATGLDSFSHRINISGSNKTHGNFGAGTWYEMTNATSIGVNVNYRTNVTDNNNALSGMVTLKAGF
jgi:uncharacterized protein with beta-barrel porin domain